ncbi:MAG: hypothetical protein AB8H79_10635 [Myxococcota bacterium]
MAVDRAIQDYLQHRSDSAVDLARVLRLGLIAPIGRRLGVEPGDGGQLLLGLSGGPRTSVRACGYTVQLPVGESLGLSPNAVTVAHRRAGQTVALQHDVRFGQPGTLRRAAEDLGLCPSLGADAVEVVLRELGALVRPRALLAAVYFADYRGWDVYRFLRVVSRVRDPEREVGVERARELEHGSALGDMVGVSLPAQDWLSPLLLWAAGAG